MPDRLRHFTIDLNADIGEGLEEADDSLIRLVTSVNIACGGHAGDRETMSRAVSAALEAGVRIGAHPSYPDRVHFGRVSVKMAPGDLIAEIVQQTRVLIEVTGELGGEVAYLKPHGALYNDAASDPAVAGAVIEAAQTLGLPLMMLAGFADRFEVTRVIREGFLDRAYRADGTLVPRGEAGALITDPQAAARQALELAGRVDSLCVHSDTPGAAAIVEASRRALRRRDSQNFPSGRGPSVEPMGDLGLVVRFDARPSRKLSRLLTGFAAAARGLEGVVDAAPGHRTVVVEMAPGEQERVAAALPRLAATAPKVEGRRHQVLLRYDGPDLQWVCRRLGLTLDELIHLHASRTYDVRILGSPGFVYLSPPPARLRVPRLEEPRPSVPAGSVGIAGRQTGIYGRARPGGWRLIATAGSVPAVDPGDVIEFVPR